VWSVVEVAKLHLDHTPRWPPGITPSTALKLHHVLGRYRSRGQGCALRPAHAESQARLRV